MERATKVFYDLAKAQTEEAARLHARVEELEAALDKAIRFAERVLSSEDDESLATGYDALEDADSMIRILATVLEAGTIQPAEEGDDETTE